MRQPHLHPRVQSPASAQRCSISGGGIAFGPLRTGESIRHLWGKHFRRINLIETTPNAPGIGNPMTRSREGEFLLRVSIDSAARVRTRLFLGVEICGFFQFPPIEANNQYATAGSYFVSGGGPTVHANRDAHCPCKCNVRQADRECPALRYATKPEPRVSNGVGKTLDRKGVFRRGSVESRVFRRLFVDGLLESLHDGLNRFLGLVHIVLQDKDP